MTNLTDDRRPRDQFARILQTVADLAADHLGQSQDRDTPVRTPITPDEIRDQITIRPSQQGRQLDGLVDELRDLLAISVRTTHPRFANQLFVGADLPGLVGEWVSALLDTTMATYEMAPAATVIERDLIDHMCSFAGFDNGEGLLTPGGTLSNLKAVMMARHHAYPTSRVHGMVGQKPPALFCSKDAHYSLSRAANILGLGVDAIYPIDTDDIGRIKPSHLREQIAQSRADGRHPFFVCSTAGTTVAGAYDPIEPVADIADDEGLWFHVDGAYGGAALLSETHRHLMAGIERADSLTWCPHKMMGLPVVCSALLVREKGRLLKALSVDADYIFHDNAQATDDLGPMSLQCGRRIDAIKLWLAWQVRGDQGYEQLVDRYFDLSQHFADLVRQRPHFVLRKQPQSCNVLFHYVPPALRHLPPGPQRLQALADATPHIREAVKERARVMVNYGPVDGHATFRMVHINPSMEKQDLPVFLDEIESAAKQLYPAPSAIEEVG